MYWVCKKALFVESWNTLYVTAAINLTLCISLLYTHGMGHLLTDHLPIPTSSFHSNNLKHPFATLKKKVNICKPMDNSRQFPNLWLTYDLLILPAIHRGFRQRRWPNRCVAMEATATRARSAPGVGWGAAWRHGARCPRSFAKLV